LLLTPLLTALSKWMPVLGYFALLMMLPALLISSYFLPTVGLIRMFTHYEPQTLKGGSLLPLPAYSLADWSLVLPEVGPTGGRRYGTAAASA
jgi:hypothetical protein